MGCCPYIAETPPDIDWTPAKWAVWALRMFWMSVVVMKDIGKVSCATA
jgi:hypothetical protein